MLSDHNALAKINYGYGHVAPSGWLNFDASLTVLLQRRPAIGPWLVKGAQGFLRTFATAT